MLGIGKKDDGRNVIEKSLDVFQKVAEELEQGIALCDEEACGIDEQMKVLGDEKALLMQSKAKATRVKANILQMLK